MAEDKDWKNDIMVRMAMREEKYQGMFEGAKLIKYAISEGTSYHSLKTNVICQGEVDGHGEFILLIKRGFKVEIYRFQREL